MTEEEQLPEITLIDRIKIPLGITLIDISAILFIGPACRLLAIKKVNNNQLWMILHRYDAERRYSRYGLELMTSFERTYMHENWLPNDCITCDFSKDHDNNSCLCSHPGAGAIAKTTPVKNHDPVPEFCPIRKNEKHTANQSLILTPVRHVDSD